MKKIYIIFLIFANVNLSHSQSSQTIHDKDGLQVSYNLLQIGSSANPITGTNFTKYKLILTVNNTSSKYWNCSHGQTISSKMLNGNTLNSSDERYMRNGGFSTIDHFSIEDNCPDYPRQGNAAAPHQVICPNSSQIGQSTFIHPTDLVGSPEITWTIGTYFEMVEDGIVRNNKVMQTNVSNNKNIYDDLEVKYFTLRQESRNSGIWEYGKRIYDYCLEKNCEQILKTKDTQQLNQIINYFEITKKKYTQNTKPSSCGSAK